MSNNIFLNSILKVLAIQSDNFPNKTINSIWNECENDFVRDGLQKSVISNIDFKSDIQSKFAHQFLPNPDYWKRKLKQKITFFFIEVKADKYKRLFEILKNFAPGVSYFVCYGKRNVIIRLIGGETSEENLDNLLTKEGFQATIISVSDTLHFYGKEVIKRKNLEKPNIPPEEIENILNSDPNSISSKKIAELEKAGVILNTVYFEDTNCTGRIRAFVGLRIEEFLSNTQLYSISSQIFKINDSEYRRVNSRPISSVYKCNSSSMVFLIEGIFDNQEQLDFVTAAIQKIELISNPVIMIIARSSFSQFSYISRSTGYLDEISIMDSLVKENLMPLTKNFLSKFPDLSQVFMENPPEKQFQVLSIFNEIVIKHKDFYTKEYQNINEFLQKYFFGILEGKIRSIQDTGMSYLRDIVEKKHFNFLEILISNILENNTEKIQGTFQMGDAKWRRWGLFVWGRKCYPNWNNHRIFGKIVEFPQEILNDFEYLGIKRNVFAHDSSLDNLNELIYILRDVFLRSFHLLNWLKESQPKVEKPFISLRDFRNIISKIDNEQVNLLTGIRFNQDEVRNLIIALDEKSNSQYDEIINMLFTFQKGVESWDEELFNSIEETFFPYIEKKNLNKAENFIKFMKDIAYSLPANIISELIAIGLLSFIFGVKP